jgi:ABC-type transport system involved in multi-copper enzyme maturation permease subunit
MKQLIEIELIKLKANRSVWIMAAIYALISIYIVGQTSSLGSATSALGASDPLSFPMIWMTGTYMSSFLVFFPAILIILNSGNEFNFKTSRQHIIDGLSRDQFILLKFVTILIIAVTLTLFIFILCLLIGLTAENDLAFGEQFSYIIGYFIYLVGVMSFAQLIVFIFKRTGVSIGVFVGYYFCLEPILYWSVFHNSNAKFYLPIETFDNLLFSPLKDNIDNLNLGFNNLSYSLDWSNAFIALIYIGVYLLIIRTIFKSRDL